MPKLQHLRHSEILERLNNGEILSITKLEKEWGTTYKTLKKFHQLSIY